LSRRIASDLEQPIAASDPLPQPEGPAKVEAPFRSEFIPWGDTGGGHHAPFGIRQPPQPVPLHYNGSSFEEFPEGQTPPPKKPNELPRR
jgi:hypothetical protein